ncbi:MAG: putative oxidoreductase [Flavobacterium sp. SCGC AAA160-P02]|nr:MAG: putative oxidoreductase [Flavobacterium sp. SCGC AAA160-P02]
MSNVVLITGASSGIGKSTADFLSNKNYIVYGTGRNPKKSENDSFSLISLDVTKLDSIEKAVDYIINKEGRIDVLVNNAGMGITGSIEDTPTDEMRKVFDTNLFGAIDVMKVVLPHMRKQQSGIIINITSIAGYMGLPYRGVYSATKGALDLVTEAIRMEAKEFGIKIATVAPGEVATNIAAGRYYTPVLENSAYKEKYQINLSLMNDHVDSGLNPIKIAQQIYNIINLSQPKVHYRVGGFMDKFSIILKKILPSKIYEKLLMNYYQL